MTYTKISPDSCDLYPLILSSTYTQVNVRSHETLALVRSYLIEPCLPLAI